MRKAISSPFTFFFKFVSPALWISIGLIALFNAVREPNLSTEKRISIMLFLVVWTGVPTLINYWNNFPLKRVYLSESALYVSNYRQEIRVPISSIHEVHSSGSWFTSWRWPSYRVIITLKEPSEFGNRILLIPGFYYKDVVREVEEAVHAQRRN